MCDKLTEPDACCYFTAMSLFLSTLKIFFFI
uniref:Macaca fascicularis brain cDNA clone: QflA-17571, similar to human aspartate beta-hydroxylase (ASPH), transcript variant 3, mRNA, RefSeq: NM_032466.1 n=1 Tax=Macaca fascicularis TaxID=9541 RepID=I7GI68_MACFA|nr:unnamed protein product [Macaca fascicularis]